MENFETYSSVSEIKNAVLFKYHMNIKFWYQMLGEIFEKSEGFTKPAEIITRLDREPCTIRWHERWQIIFK